MNRFVFPSQLSTSDVSRYIKLTNHKQHITYISFLRGKFVAIDKDIVNSGIGR